MADNSQNSKFEIRNSKILILMGPPGSGKGTQAKLLAKHFGYQHISTGDLVRGLLINPAAPPEERKEAEKSRQGILVGDWLIYRLAFREIERTLAAGQGVILDGAIRNLSQAQEFTKFLQSKNFWEETRVIWVALSDEEGWERLTKRRNCSACGEIIPYLPETKDLEVCPKCRGPLSVRPDDNPEALKKRFAEQGNAAQKPILDFFRVRVGANGHSPVVEVDGRPDIETVFGEILEKM